MMPRAVALGLVLLAGRVTCQDMPMGNAPTGGGGGGMAPTAAAGPAGPPGKPKACPSLPPPAPSVKKFSLTAAKFDSKTQTLAYNGTAVGPMIRVRLGDEIQVDVTNKDIQEGTSVHWHGQDLPNAAWADGVAGVSQAPLPAGSTFSYRFKAEPAGTFWYHSHTGEQYGDGLRGPLIVDDPSDPHKGLYDTDADAHVLMLADVFDTTVAQQLRALQSGGMGGMGAGGGAAGGGMGAPAAANSMGGMGAPAAPGGMGGMAGEKPAGGMGQMQAGCPPGVLDQDISDAPWYGVQVNGQGWITDPKTMQRTGQPLVVTVEKGKRHRLRLIGGTSSWALRVGVQGHPLQLIALDGRPVQPLDADSLLLTSGERADVVLHADQPVGNYWMDVSTISGQNSPVIIHYSGAPDPLTDKRFLGTARADTGCAVGSPKILDLKNATLRAAPGVPQPPKAANKQFTIYLPDAATTAPPKSFLATAAKAGNPLGLAPGSAPPSTPGCPPMEDGTASKYCWSLNWNIYAPPSKVALLPGAKNAPRTLNLELAEGDVVDLLLINPSLMVHPMHIHGTGFWLLASGNGLAASASEGLAPGVALNLANPPVRDTVPVPQALAAPGGGMAGAAEPAPAGYGYAIVRFRAANPGVWAFHCHIDLHAASGMFMTVTTRPKNNGTWVVPDNLLCA